MTIKSIECHTFYVEQLFILFVWWNSQLLCLRPIGWIIMSAVFGTIWNGLSKQHYYIFWLDFFHFFLCGYPNAKRRRRKKWFIKVQFSRQRCFFLLSFDHGNHTEIQSEKKNFQLMNSIHIKYKCRQYATRAIDNTTTTKKL